MTHTLHRSGDLSSLKRDYVWLMYQSKGINDSNIEPKARVFVEAAEACNCVNWGDVKSGSILELPAAEVKARLSDKSRVRGVFTSRADVVCFLKKVKEADLGISVVISGLIDEVFQACREADLQPHTVNFSLGVWGNLDRLPPQEILDITTMCGHHQVSSGIVEKMIDDVIVGRTTSRVAGVDLAKLCPCGIFNQVRAGEQIDEIVSRRSGQLGGTRPAL